MYLDEWRLEREKYMLLIPDGVWLLPNQVIDILAEKANITAHDARLMFNRLRRHNMFLKRKFGDYSNVMVYKKIQDSENGEIKGGGEEGGV